LAPAIDLSQFGINTNGAADAAAAKKPNETNSNANAITNGTSAGAPKAGDSNDILASLGLGTMAGMGADMFNLSALGLPGLGQPLAGLPTVPGLPTLGMAGLPSFNTPMMSLPSTFPSAHSGPLMPGSAAHAAAFHAKGPDGEIKLFIGGLAFSTQGMLLTE